MTKRTPATPDQQADAIDSSIQSAVSEQSTERQQIAKAVAALKDNANTLQQQRMDMLGRIRNRRMRFAEMMRQITMLDREAERHEMEVVASIRAGMVAAALTEGDLIS